MEKLIIDPEFEGKIPPMSDDSFDGLRADILRDGYVRDPLVVWKEENVLLDGHHRWKVIRENPDVLEGKYSIDYMSFPDRWAAIAWICANQLHRHNLTDIQMVKLLQEEHDARKRIQGGTGANQYTSEQSGEIHHSAKDNKIRQEIATEHGITPAAVRTAVEVGRGIDKAATVDPEFKLEVLSGKVKAKKSDLAALRKIEDQDELASAVQEIRNPTPKEKKPSPNPKGFDKETREKKNLIDQLVRGIMDDNAGAGATIDTLCEEVKSSGEEFVRHLRTVIASQSYLLDGDESRSKVRSSIDEIISNIEKVRNLL